MKKIDVIFISIHSLRMEGDGKFSSKSGRGQLFQSTPSAWRETVTFPSPTWEASFQSTPSAWRETCDNIRSYFSIGISIHSLRMEGDFLAFHFRCNSRISIHSLRMEGDGLSFSLST